MIGEVQYGDVLLEVVKTHDHRQTMMYTKDQKDLIDVQHMIEVACVLNPSATSYKGVNDKGVPQQGDGAFAGRTLRAISDYLSQPRRTLIIWAYDHDGSKRILFESPPRGSGRVARLECDSRGGPFCRVIGIRGENVYGAKTMILHIVFEFYSRGCYGSHTPIISNRYSESVDVHGADGGYAIRTTRGEVVFDLGRLRSARQQPDFYRSVLFAGVPPNFVREHVSTEADSDGQTIRYTVVDAERPKNVGENSPATRLEGMVTVWFQHGSAGVALSQSAPTLWNNGFRIATGPLQAIQAMNNSIETFGANVTSQLPTYYANAKIRAHGARNSSTYDLYRLCLAMCFARLGPPQWLSQATRTQFTLAVALDQNFVEVDYTMMWADAVFTRLAGVLGPLGPLVANVTSTFGLNQRTFAFLEQYFPDPTNDDPLGNDTVINAESARAVFPGMELIAGGLTPDGRFLRLLTAKPTVGNRPLNLPARGVVVPDRNTRGIGYMRYIVTKGLLGELCDIPELPGDWDTDTGGMGVPHVNVPFMPSASGPTGG